MGSLGNGGCAAFRGAEEASTEQILTVTEGQRKIQFLLHVNEKDSLWQMRDKELQVILDNDVAGIDLAVAWLCYYTVPGIGTAIPAPETPAVEQLAVQAQAFPCPAAGILKELFACSSVCLALRATKLQLLFHLTLHTTRTRFQRLGILSLPFRVKCHIQLYKIENTSITLTN